VNRSKAKGTAWETALVEYLKVSGFPYAERRALCGTSDRGDVAGIPGVVLEAKAEKVIDLAGYMNEVAAEKRNAGAQVGAAVIKRRSHGTDRAYVVMELCDFVELIR
jgi:hypothetical protein